MKNGRSLVMRAFAVMLLALVFITGVNSSARCQACPPDDVGCSAWFPLTKTITFGSCTMTITAQYRVCSGKLQIQNQGYTLTGDCSLWMDSTLQQLADIFMIGQANDAAANNSSLSWPMPVCPTTAQEVEYYSSACYIWVKCTYNTDNSNPVCTPPDWNPGPSPSVDVWTWHDCGTSCCKRIYNVCMNPDPAYDVETYPTDLNSLTVTLVGRVRVVPCSDNQPGSTPHWSATCNDGC